MNFFGIGLPEMAVIAAIGLLVFGPKRLPELGRTLGRTLKGFQSASKEFEQEFRNAIDTESAVAPAASISAAPPAEAVAAPAAAVVEGELPGVAGASPSVEPPAVVEAPPARGAETVVVEVVAEPPPAG